MLVRRASRILSRSEVISNDRASRRKSTLNALHSKTAVMPTA